MQQKWPRATFRRCAEMPGINLEVHAVVQRQCPACGVLEQLVSQASIRADGNHRVFVSEDTLNVPATQS